MAESEASPLLNSFLLGAALVVTVGVVIWMAGGETPPAAEHTAGAEDPAPSDAQAGLFTLQPFAFDVARLEAEWAAEQAAHPLEVGADEERLVEAYSAINEQAARGVDETQLAALNDRFVVDVARYLVVHGPRSYRAVAWLLIGPFREALDDVLAQARQRGVTPEDVLTGRDSQARTWRERLGNFFSMARRGGLLDAEGEPTADPALLTALFRYRWFGFAEDYASPSLLTPYERVVLWRWRIEAADGLPLQQRLALIEEIEPAYDGPLAPDAVRAVLYYQQGDRQRARGYLRQAAERNPGDPRYERLLGALDAAAPAGP